MKIFKLYRNVFSGLSSEVWLLSIANFINRAGSMVLPFLSLFLTTDLHFSKTETSIVLGFFGVGSILGSLLGGYLVDKFHYKPIQVTSLFLSGLLCLPLMFLDSLWLICADVFLLALVADMFRPANTVAVSLHSSPENRTRSFGLMRLAFNLGFSVGPAIGGFIAFRYSYFWLFLIDAVTCFLAGIILWYKLQSLEVAPTDSAKDKVLQKKSSQPFYENKRYLAFLVLACVYACCFFQLFSSVPLFLKEEFHYSEDLVGNFLALNGLIVVLIEMPFLFFYENNPKSLSFIPLGMLMLSLSFWFIIPSSGMLLLTILYTIFITLSEVFAMPFMMNYTIVAAPVDRRGEYSSMYSMMYGIALVVAPVVGLNIAQLFSFQALYTAISIISIFLAIGFYFALDLHRK